jgi:nitroreductase
MKIWKEILETAVYTPSPHNVQPWRVKIISDTRAELYIDSSRTLPKEDMTGSFIILTMGMFTEALKILAAANGFNLSYTLFHEPDWFAPMILETVNHELIPFAAIELSESEHVSNFDTNLFFKRRTSRLNFRGELIPDKAFKKLAHIADEWNQKFAILIDRGQIEQLMQLNTEAVFEDLNTPAYHDEIAQWFRYSDAQSARHLDGLDARAMNISPVNLWLSAHAPWLMKIPIAREILARVYRSQSGKIPTLGIISGGFWKPDDAIETGKFLIRFWLETAALDLYIHPFGNLVTNKRIAALVEKETGISNAWLIFKIGFSDEPPKSRRLPVEKILVE